MRIIQILSVVLVLAALDAFDPLRGQVSPDPVNILRQQAALPPAVHLRDQQYDILGSIYETAIETAFGSCGTPCHVRENRGGMIDVFGMAATGFLAGARAGMDDKHRRVSLVIDGLCASACALAADYAAPVTCITPRAQFAFHRSTSEVEPSHTRAISAWVHQHGGFPSNASHDLTYMTYKQALAFWQPCR